MATIYKTLNDHSVLIEFGQTIAPDLLEKVTGLDLLIRDSGLYGIIETVPGYASLAVFYNPEIWEEADLILKLKGLETKVPGMFMPQPKLWEIPITYHDPEMPDMLAVLKYTGLSHQKIIEFHQQTEYLVYMLGFLPGFIYLGGLDKRLHMPRKKVPDLKTAAGSVAIGGAQTGIYSLESPAGWHVIGQTDMTFFDKSKSPPINIRPGDKVLFTAQKIR